MKQDSTKRLRDTSQQSKYRKNSASKLKPTKHVAHTLDLELAKHISKKSKGKENTKKLKLVLNHKSNFKMIDQKINLSQHKEIVKSLVYKSESGMELSRVEEAKAKAQVKFLDANKKILPKGFVNSSIKFYKKLKLKDGDKLILKH